ncbi:MAG: bifunctional nuclease family protein [Planctomycetota bacterium]|nr:bifunctional nuclease family protein [Planctomycetota bacterium]
MELSRILIREIADAQFIELREIEGERTFPIVVGKPEAYAIDRRLKGIEPPRPQTLELLASIVDEMGCTFQEIVIDDLQDGTFFAKLKIDCKGEEIIIDSRPSDAIALGIAAKIPILVEEHVLDEVEHDGDGYSSPETFDWD